MHIYNAHIYPRAAIFKDNSYTYIHINNVSAPLPRWAMQTQVFLAFSMRIAGAH